MAMNSVLKIFLITIVLIACYQTEADEMRFSRTNFGYSNLPIWTALRPFEESAISQPSGIDQQDNLFAIYLIAGGEVRSQADFNPYQQRLHTWLLDIDGDINRKRTARKKGEFLFTSMHQQFFHGENFSGYHADQSQLEKIFDEGTYNCISSAMLYIVAAQKINLKVSGVLIPSHAFVQLELQDGSTIDIETTSQDGYAINHDADFYQHQANEWASERELEPPSYQDYLDREIIEPLSLGLTNMWSQHTSKSRMTYENRLRLAEIRSHLSPKDQDAQINRLVFYLAEFAHLDGEKDHSTLLRLFRKIEPYLEQLEIEGNQELQALSTQLWAGFALTLMKEKYFTEGLTLTKRTEASRFGMDSFDTFDAFDAFDAFDTLEEQTENILFYAMDLYARNLVAENRFEEARFELLNFSLECRFQDICRTSLIQVYLAWAQQYWKTNDWEEVILLLAQYSGLYEEGDGNQVIRANLITAYTNWAQDLVFDGDWELGVDKLNTCLQQLPEAAACQSGLDKIAQRHEDGYL